MSSWEGRTLLHTAVRRRLGLFFLSHITEGLLLSFLCYMCVTGSESVCVCFRVVFPINKRMGIELSGSFNGNVYCKIHY